MLMKIRIYDASTYFCTVLYPRVPYVLNYMICTPTREMNMMTYKGYVHVCVYIYIIPENG